MGSKKITYYLERYHGMNVSESTVTRIFNTYGLRRLERTARKRITHSKRNAKSIPGHHVQVDIKFLLFNKYVNLHWPHLITLSGPTHGLFLSRRGREKACRFTGIQLLDSRIQTFTGSVATRSRFAPPL